MHRIDCRLFDIQPVKATLPIKIGKLQRPGGTSVCGRRSSTGAKFLSGAIQGGGPGRIFEDDLQGPS